MYKFRLHKKLTIWILISIQLITIISFFYLELDGKSTRAKHEKISFIPTKNESRSNNHAYHTVNSRIFLKSLGTRGKFIDFNSSLCYINGTDLSSMKRTNLNWNCECLPGWHGYDCGQPEVVWRAFLTRRKPITLKGPRILQRRIIYIFPINKFSELITNLRINELADVVDLFILLPNEPTPNLSYLEHQNKILILNLNETNPWSCIKTSIRNIKDDDIIVISGSNEIPNKFALEFLKIYDKWPEPVLFRLKWTIFGFFWLHPSKTIITKGACTVSYFKKNFNGNIKLLNDNILSHGGLILGDLNHFGGWYCEFCNDAAQIVENLSKHAQNRHIDLGKIHKIDAAYMEDLIENGIYIDGKTGLVRARKYRDNYFAPFYALKNDWKYDFLLSNFYSKIDYYEG